MPETPEFLIDGILPSGEAHLIGGASGSGKTTWIFRNFLAEWQQGRAVFGHESHPVPYVYVSLDRSRSSVNRTLQRLHLTSEITRMVCLDDMPDECLQLNKVIDFALTRYPGSQLIIIEGFALLSGDATSSYTGVGKLMRRAARLCTKQGITLIGICHAPKMKTDESFQHSRELLLGSVSWAAYSDTIIVLNLDEKTNTIAFKVMPRNAAMENHDFMFGPAGILIPCPKDKGERLYAWITAVPEGQLIERQRILDVAEEFDISRATADRIIERCLTENQLERVTDGTYKRARTN